MVNMLLVMLAVGHLNVTSAFAHNNAGRRFAQILSVPLQQRSRTCATSGDDCNYDDDHKSLGESFDVHKNMDRRRMMSISIAGLCFSASAPGASFASDEPAVLGQNNGEYNLNCLLDLPPPAPNNIRLFLCRHGQTENNRLHLVQGARIDPPLNLTGRCMAERVGGAFSKLETNLRPAIVVHSQLLRATETAQCAASVINDSSLNAGREVELRTLSSLGEVDFGPSAEGKPAVEVKATMTKIYGKWAIGNIDAKPELGGESGREVLERAASALTVLTEYAAKADCASLVAVSHSTYIKMLLSLCMNISLFEAAKMELKNGCINVIDIDMRKPMKTIGHDSPVFGEALSIAPMDTRIAIPSVKVVRINETRHLADLV